MSPEQTTIIPLNNAHLCADLECRTISDSPGACPRCTSQTTTVACLIENGTNALAHEIAIESAKDEIAILAKQARAEGKQWFDVAHFTNGSQRVGVQRAVRYLEGCGLLIRHAEKPELIRWEAH